MSRRALSIGLGLGMTALFLWLAARNVSLPELAAALAAARWRWLPFMLGMGLADLVIRAARWKILLWRAAPRAGVWTLFKLEAIGLALNNVLFLRVGELARAFLAGRELGAHVASTLASVAVERALDVAALLLLFCAAAALAPQFVPAALRRAGLLALCGVLAAIGALAVGEGQVWRLKRWPGVHRLAAQLAQGAAVLREPAPAAAAAVLSLGLWSVDALVYWAGARALSLGALVSYPRAILVLSWAGAAAALPAAPGAFGTFEALVKSILVDFGAGPDAAFACAVFTHMTTYLTATVLGLLFLWQVGLSFGELTRAVQGMQR